MTGGGGQIGQVIVIVFLSAGCKVIVLNVDSSKFGFEVEKLLWVEVAMTDENAMRHAWTRVRDHSGNGPNVCVCAVGLDSSFIEHHRSIVDTYVEQFRRTLELRSLGLSLGS